MAESRTATFMATQPSNPYLSTKKANFVSLEEVNAEAKEKLAQKQAELDSYAETVAKAEKILTQLQEQLKAKEEELAALTAPDQADELEQEEIQKRLSELETKHKEEIQQMKAKHEDEMASLRADFEQMLQESENWANQHSQIALQEKMNELNVLKEEAMEAKRQLNEATLVKQKSKTQTMIDEAQRSNAEQIAQLEEQISELTAITREELRDARAKIDECVAAVELRRQTHAAEVQRLEDEATQRTERYNALIQALKEQYSLERSTIEQQISAANARAENTEKIIKQLEQHHETQLSEVLADIDTMRRSLSASSRKPSEHSNLMRSTVRESQKIAENIRALDEEAKMIDREISELEDENRETKHEITQLTALLQHNSI